MSGFEMITVGDDILWLIKLFIKKIFREIFFSKLIISLQDLNLKLSLVS